MSTQERDTTTGPLFGGTPQPAAASPDAGSEAARAAAQPDPSIVPDWVHDIVPIDRALAILDIEATGTAPHRDRIVEICVLKLYPDGRKLLRQRRINPGMPIPADATAVHGIRNEDVVHEPDFPQVAVKLAELLADCDLAGFGIVQFDLPILRTEFDRAGVEFPIEGRRIIDSKAIYHAREPRTLAAAHSFYCGAEFDDAHSAEADTLATYRVLVSQIQRYEDLPRSLDELHRLSNPRQADFVDSEGKLIWRDGEVYFNFGKHRGVPLREVCAIDTEYARWLTQKEFRADFKTVVAAALEGRYPEPRRGAADVAAAARGLDDDSRR